MIAVLWTYEAWYFVTYAAGEIKDPQRNLPRALFIGIVALTTIYLVVNLAYLYALPIDEMQGVTRIAERAATALVGPGGATFVALTVVVSTFGCNAAGDPRAGRGCCSRWRRTACSCRPRSRSTRATARRTSRSSR